MSLASQFRPSRRRILGGSLAAAVGTSLRSWSLAASPIGAADPYAGIDWERCLRIGSVTHAHCRSQKQLDTLCGRGLRHLAISNYYPSVPCRADECRGEYYVHQGFATVEGRGYVEEDFFWNDIIRDPVTGWYDELPDDLRSQMPFFKAEPLFTAVPENVMLCPNAEHHSLTDSGGHFNAVGSAFRSGTFDVRGRHRLFKHGYPIGVALPWRETFDRIFAALEVPDGGGLTLNHPVWSRLKPEQMLEMLDADERVLGIEIWNQTCEEINGRGWALDIWDAILRTGRRCFGFAVSDHAHSSRPDFQGFHVLLVDASTTVAELPAACLRAYRQGAFYAALSGTARFERVEWRRGHLTVRVSEPATIRVVSGVGVVHERIGAETEYAPAAGSLGRLGYLRVEAATLDGRDRLFTQPLVVPAA